MPSDPGRRLLIHLCPSLPLLPLLPEGTGFGVGLISRRAEYAAVKRLPYGCADCLGGGLFGRQRLTRG